MDISNNTLSAFMANKSTVQEDRMIYQEMANNEEFSDLLDVLNDVDAIDGLDDLRNEFNEYIEDIDNVDRHVINIK